MNINPQFIKGSDGSELVVITRAEYDALVSHLAEDDEDVAIFDARMADLKAEDAAALPEDITRSMLNGDSLLKALRKRQKAGDAGDASQDHGGP